MIYGKENHMLINKLSYRRAFAGRYTVNYLIASYVFREVSFENIFS